MLLELIVDKWLSGVSQLNLRAERILHGSFGSGMLVGEGMYLMYAFVQTWFRLFLKKLSSYEAFHEPHKGTSFRTLMALATPLIRNTTRP